MASDGLQQKKRSRWPRPRSIGLSWREALSLQSSVDEPNPFENEYPRFGRGQPLLLLPDWDVAASSLSFEGLNIPKRRHLLCVCTISDTQCTQSSSPSTGTNLHLMPTLRWWLRVLIPVAEVCFCSWATVCLQSMSICCEGELSAFGASSSTAEPKTKAMNACERLHIHELFLHVNKLKTASNCYILKAKATLNII